MNMNQYQLRQNANQRNDTVVIPLENMNQETNLLIQISFWQMTVSL
jgi:hypothetical protein